jgi:periplasmic protein TonB
MTARSQPALALWSTSACAALLVHTALAALLFVSWSRRLPLPTGSPGVPNALDVEIAPAPAPAPTPVPTPAPPTRISSDSTRRTPSALQVQALPEMVSLTSDPSPPPIQQPAPTPAQAAAQQSLTSADSLTSIAPLGEPNDSASSRNAWLAQVETQLARYKQYPPSARRRRQQDTVRLQFSVDRAGRVTTSHVDSAHHYKVLEQEVQHMLQLASPLPAPPADFSADSTVIHTDVAFSLLRAKPAPSTAAAAACSRPAAPGPAPAGGSSTLEQMHTYQDHLQQYAAATRSYLGCLAAGHATPQADSAITQLNALVARFNTQAQEFKKAAQLRVQQAQQQAEQAAAARFAQARSMTEKAYTACTASLPSARPPPATRLTAAALPAYRKRLLAYEAAVHAYLACIDQARHAVAAQIGSGLTPEQRIELEVDATNTGHAAMDPLNQLIVAFNTQLHKLQEQSISAQQQLAAVFARDSALFPNSTWSVPAPLPTDECIRIARVGQGYVAQLCKSSYTAQVASSPAANAPGTARASRGGDIFVTQAPLGLGNETAADSYQTTSYSVSELQVAGTHISMTISRRSVETALASDPGSDAIHFELTLSPDRQTLSGQCSTGPQHRNCQLSRRP